MLGLSWCGWWRPDVDHHSANTFFTEMQSYSCCKTNWSVVLHEISFMVLVFQWLVTLIPHFFFFFIHFLWPRTSYKESLWFNSFYSLFGPLVILSNLNVNVSNSTLKSLVKKSIFFYYLHATCNLTSKNHNRDWREIFFHFTWQSPSSPMRLLKM